LRAEASCASFFNYYNDARSNKHYNLIINHHSPLIVLFPQIFPFYIGHLVIKPIYLCLPSVSPPLPTPQFLPKFFFLSFHTTSCLACSFHLYLKPSFAHFPFNITFRTFFGNLIRVTEYTTVLTQVHAQKILMTEVGYWKLLLHYSQYYVYKQYDTNTF